MQINQTLSSLGQHKKELIISRVSESRIMKIMDSRFSCKDYVKFLGVLIDKNLTWRPHIDHIASKISKIVGIMARLRHHVPLNALLQIYRSLIFPYTLYGILAWGQASQCDLKMILTLQKRALRLIFFASKRSHAIPLCVASNILPVNMLYFVTVSTIMHDVSTHSTPKNIRELFIHVSDVQYNMRFSGADNLFEQKSRLNMKLK